MRASGALTRTGGARASAGQTALPALRGGFPAGEGQGARSAPALRPQGSTTRTAGRMMSAGAGAPEGRLQRLARIGARSPLAGRARHARGS